MTPLLFVWLWCALTVSAKLWSTRSLDAGNTVQPGEQFELDVDLVSAQPLIVLGQLTCADKDLKISVPRISIGGNGKFICGTANDRYTKKLTITMTGPRVDNSNIFDSKCISVTGSGVLELHGENRPVTWTQLGVTARRNVDEITLSEAVDWRVGEKIVIASTDFDMDQAETRTITNVDPTGKVLTLNAKLSYTHWGRLQRFNNAKMVLDERAEVALLSRNIVFQGDDEAANLKQGAHIIITGQGQGRVDGVELTKVGLEKVLGRYPIHWHLRGDGQAQYARKNSIHHTFNRCVTVHGTDNLMISDNLCMESAGHGYFIEDGFEQNNQFIHNLGLLTRQQTIDNALLPTDHTTVSTFWITNPNNTFRRNAAAGSDFAGFWFALPSTPVGAGSGKTMIRPQNTNIKVFDDNRAHSSPHANLAIDGQPAADDSRLVHSHYTPLVNPLDASQGKAIPVIRRFTSFKAVARSIWIRATTLKFVDCVHADNGLSTLLAFNQLQTRSLYVGISANWGTPSSPLELAAGMSLPFKYRQSLEDAQFVGHAIYDGPTFTLDTHFANFDKRWTKAFQAVGAAIKSPAHVVSGLSFENTPPHNRVDFAFGGARGTIIASGIIDRDGTLSGAANSTVAARPSPMPINNWPTQPCFNSMPSVCQDRPDWNAAVCSGIRYALLFLKTNYPMDNSNNDDIGVVRSDGLATQFYSKYGTFGSEQFQVIVNKGLSYRLTYGRIPANLFLRFTFAVPGESVTLEFPNWPKLASVRNAVSVSSLAELNASKGSSYYQIDNNLVVRLVAQVGSSGYEDELGKAHLPGVAQVRLCLNANCGHEPLRYVAQLADFESGFVDTRASVAAQKDLDATELKYHLTPANNDGINYFDVTSPNLGQAKYADFTLRFAPQNWLVYRALHLHLAAGCLRPADCKDDAQVEVHLHDRDSNFMLLGKGRGKFALALPQDRPQFLDAVDTIIIRIRNTAFLADLAGTATFRTHLYSLSLLHFVDAAAAYPRPVDAKLPTEVACPFEQQSFFTVPSTPQPVALPSLEGIPRGRLDVADATRIRGWACDSDTGGAPLQIHIYITPSDTGVRVFYKSINADQPRPDITNAFPQDCPGNHGFVYYWPNTMVEQAWGNSEVSVTTYAIDVPTEGTQGRYNPVLGTKRTVVQPSDATPRPIVSPAVAPVPKAPIGAVDTLNEKYVAGWVCDVDTPAQSISIRIYFNNILAFEHVAQLDRPDLMNVAACVGSIKHGFHFEWNGAKILPEFESKGVEVKVFAVNTGAKVQNPQLFAKTLKIVRQDKSNLNAAKCQKGNAGCGCSSSGTCGAGLTCVADKCVVQSSCKPGTSGCSCMNNSLCNDSNTECVENRCLQKSCPKGDRGCACNTGAGSDPGMYACTDTADECVAQLSGSVCLPKSSSNCAGKMACFCRQSGDACDPGLVCGLNGRCGLPQCEEGTKGCSCSSAGHCSEGLDCVSSQCVVPKCDGQLACRCREGLPDVAPTKIGGDNDIGVDEEILLSCDAGLRCLRAEDDSSAFCVRAQTEASPAPSASTVVTFSDSTVVDGGTTAGDAATTAVSTNTDVTTIAGTQPEPSISTDYQVTAASTFFVNQLLLTVVTIYTLM